MILVPGMIFTIEPMINQGISDLYIDADKGGHHILMMENYQLNGNI